MQKEGTNVTELITNILTDLKTHNSYEMLANEVQRTIWLGVLIYLL